MLGFVNLFSEPTTHWVLEEILKCSVCAEYLKDPVSIACGHTYCRPCISTYQAGENMCPKCGKTSEPCNYLHPNRALAEVLEKIQVTHAEMETHSKMELKLCSVHHKVLAMFCVTDEEAICKDCAVQDHREHAKQYIQVYHTI